MTSPLQTLDLSASIYRVTEGTFGLVTDAELSTAAWGSIFRMGGPRHMRWIAELAMAPQYDDGFEDRRMTWDATVARMMGGFIGMRLHHPARIYPRGFGAGIYRPGTGSKSLGGKHAIDGGHLVDGVYYLDGGSTLAYVGSDARRYADAIHMTGLWPSSKVFHAGDHFGLGGNLYMVTDNCTSDANGECTVPFLWRLWKPALAGDRIELHQPTARFVLASADEGKQSYSSLIGSTSLSAVEVPYVE
jgi:hypothetical protein